MEEEEKEVVSYRKEQALNIIEQYKDLMKKYDLVFDIDVLEKELAKASDDEQKAEAEKKLLDKLDNRRSALEKKEEILEKIYSLEKHLSNEHDQGIEKLEDRGGHPTSRHRRQG